jgi:uncharacterized protein YyaL (SSP411 family)
MMAAALSTWSAGVQQVVIVGDQGAEALVGAVGSTYRPFTLMLVLSEPQRLAMADLAPWIAEMAPVGAQATAYVCRNFACERPVTDVEGLIARLASAP